MDRRLVEDSSTIASVGYDREKQILEVEFKGKKQSVYEYKDFPADLFEEWEKNQFGGKFFHSRIKTANFWYRLKQA